MKVDDPTMYTGALGSAMLCFKAYLTTNSARDLTLLSEIVDSCCAAAPTVPEYARTNSILGSNQNYMNPICRGDLFI